MTQDEAIKMIIEHLQGLFPKTCPKCKRRFESLREFYLATTPVGRPVSYDLKAGNIHPQKPLGAVAVSACGCGAALSLSSEGMPLFQYWSLLLWAKNETRRRSISVSELLDNLRFEVRKRVIAEADRGGAKGDRSK